MTEKQSITEAIRTIRTNLQYQAEFLRQFDQELGDSAAHRLERLRSDLRRFTKDDDEVPDEKF